MIDPLDEHDPGGDPVGPDETDADLFGEGDEPTFDCPECGAAIWAQAAVCPRCGHAVTERERRRGEKGGWWRSWWVAVVVVLVILGLLVWSL